MLVNADIGWSWVKSGSSFAAIAGILAAFTISAIVLLLSRPPGREAEDEGRKKATQHLFYAFLVSLYSFVVSALLFATVTGATQDESATSYFIGMFAGTILSVAAMQLLLAIIWTAAEYDSWISLRGAKVLFAIIVALAASFIIIDYGDYAEVISKSSVYWAVASPWLPMAGALLMFVLPVGFGVGARRRTWRKYTSKTGSLRETYLRETAYSLHDTALWVSVGVTTAMILFANTLADFSADAAAPPFPPWMSLTAMALVGLCVGYFIWSLPYKDSVVESLVEKAKKTPLRKRSAPASADRLREVAHTDGQMSSHDNRTAIYDHIKDAFGPALVSTLGVIQGVALGALGVVIFANLQHFTLARWLQVAATFLVLAGAWDTITKDALVWRWVPDFEESFLPFVLGAAELYLIYSITLSVGFWLLGLALVAFLRWFGYQHVRKRGKEETKALVDELEPHLLRAERVSIAGMLLFGALAIVNLIGVFTSPDKTLHGLLTLVESASAVAWVSVATVNGVQLWRQLVSRIHPGSKGSDENTPHRITGDQNVKEANGT